MDIEKEIVQYNENKEKNNNLPILDQLLLKYKYGKITWKVFFITFIILCMEGIHVGLFGQLIIPIQQFYSLSETEVQIHSSLLFLSLSFGSILSGYLSKRFTRRNIILFILLTISISHLIIGVIHEIYTFAFFRFVIGFCIGMITPLIFNIFAEYLPLNYRGVSLTIVWSGLNTGQTIFNVMNLLIMPNYETNKYPQMMLYSSIISILPLIISFFFLTDSPRNLILTGDNKQAFEILDEINGEPLTEYHKEKITFEIKSGMNSDINGNLSEIFNNKYILTSTLLSFIWIINAFVNYGPALIISLTMKDMNIETINTNNEIIWKSLYMKLIILPTITIGGILCEIPFLGRKKTSILLSFIGLIMIILLFTLKNHIEILFALNNSFLSICYSVITTYSTEVYATKIRDIALGYLYFMTRQSCFLSQILFLWFHKLGTWIPYYLVGIFVIINIVLIYLLPQETFQKSLDTDSGNNNQSDNDETNNLLKNE